MSITLTCLSCYRPSDPVHTTVNPKTLQAGHKASHLAGCWHLTARGSLPRTAVCRFDLGSILTRAHSLWHPPSPASAAAAAEAAEEEGPPQGEAYPPAYLLEHSY